MLLIPTVALLAACGGGEVKSEPKAPPEPAPQAAATPDSAAKPATGTMAVDIGTTTQASPTRKAEGPLRDSAFGPKYMVDSTGKVVPIKRP